MIDKNIVNVFSAKDLSLLTREHLIAENDRLEYEKDQLQLRIYRLNDLLSKYEQIDEEELKHANQSKDDSDLW